MIKMASASAIVACAFLALPHPARAQFASNPEIPNLLRDGIISVRPENMDALLDIAAVYFSISTINRCSLIDVPDDIDVAVLMSDFTDYLVQRPDLAALVSSTFPLLAAHPMSLRVSAQVLALGCDHPDIQSMYAQSIIVLSDHRTRVMSRTYANTGIPLHRETSRPVARRILGPRVRDRAISEAERQAIVNSVVTTRDSGQEVLDCIYGPMQADGRGFREYHLWKDRLPPFTRDEILRLGPNSELANLPYIASSACPGTEEIAADIVRRHGFSYPGTTPFAPEPHSRTTDVEAIAAEPDSRPDSTRPPTISIAADYTLSGINPGGGRYAGVVSVTSLGGNDYAFQWTIGRQLFQGHGTLHDGRISVEFGGQYPANYQVDADGNLTGTWANGQGSEYLVRQ